MRLSADKNLRNIFSFGILLTALILGAGYRMADIKENFSVNGGFEYFVNMASHFYLEPGGYNSEEVKKMEDSPDEYVFSRHPSGKVTNSFENEKGWAFILSLVLPEGQKGVSNLARTVVKYQLMIDLLVIVLLFYCGRSAEGFLGGSIVAMLYAIFKPSAKMVSWVSYYYWAVPLSAISLFFWVFIYKPEERKYSTIFSSFLFLLYGAFMGFAASVRFSFLFLPLFMSPFIFLREKNFKKALIFFVSMLLGQALLLAPQVYMTHKFYGEWSVSVRGKWHGVIQGLGSYTNPWGISDATDEFAKKWAAERGGPDIRSSNADKTVTIQKYDSFMKKEAIKFFKERPDIFFRNFYTNMHDAAGLYWRRATGPAFFGYRRTFYFFPYLIVLSFIVFLFFRKKYFSLFLSVTAHGFYILAVLCAYFAPTENHMTAYFPVFVLLLSIGLAVLIKIVAGVLERQYPAAIIMFAVLAVGVGIHLLPKNTSPRLAGLLSEVRVAWDMDDHSTENVIVSADGANDAIEAYTELVKGVWSEARYFNGKEASIQTRTNFKGWKGITIALWVKPKHGESGRSEVILDNGHTADKGFVIQSDSVNDQDRSKWVFHCYGVDIPLRLLPNKWSQVVITADAASGAIEAFVNGASAGRSIVENGFEFSDTPLVIGRLATSPRRYFRGSIDEVIILDRSVSAEEIKSWPALVK